MASFEYQLHPVGPMITGGLVAHPFERARDVLRFFRDVTASLPDEFTVFAGLIHAPDGSGTKLAAMVLVTAARLPTAKRRCGRSSNSVPGDGRYRPDALLPAQRDARCRLSEGSAQLLEVELPCPVERRCHRHDDRVLRQMPVAMGQMLLEHFHGAATRVEVGDTAFPHRADGYNFLVLAEWMDPAQTDRCIAWARETYAAMKPFMASGRYVNYLADDETGDPVAAAYGPNYPRLQELKAKYDPGNFFHMNQNIRPSS